MNTNIWNQDDTKEMIEEKKRLVKEGHEDESIYKFEFPNGDYWVSVS